MILKTNERKHVRTSMAYLEELVVKAKESWLAFLALMLRKLFSILRSVSYSSSDKHESSFSPKNFLRRQTLCLDKFATHCSNMRWADDRSRTHCLEASRSSSFFDKLSASYFRCYMKIYSCKKYLLPWQRSNPTNKSKSYVSCYQLVLLHIFLYTSCSWFFREDSKNKLNILISFQGTKKGMMDLCILFPCCAAGVFFRSFSITLECAL